MSLCTWPMKCSSGWKNGRLLPTPSRLCRDVYNGTGSIGKGWDCCVYCMAAGWWVVEKRILSTGHCFLIQQGTIWPSNGCLLGVLWLNRAGSLRLCRSIDLSLYCLMSWDFPNWALYISALETTNMSPLFGQYKISFKWNYATIIRLHY